MSCRRGHGTSRWQDWLCWVMGCRHAVVAVLAFSGLPSSLEDQYICAQEFSVTMEVRTVQCGGVEGSMSSCQRPGCKSWGKMTACGSLKSACIFRVPEGHGHHVGDGSRKDCACLDCAERLGLLSGRVYHCTWCRIASTIGKVAIPEGPEHIASLVPKNLLAVCGRCRLRR